MEQITEYLKLHLERLCKFSATPGQGVTRLPFSKEARMATEYLTTMMAQAGLSVTTDLVGNVRGRLEGTQPGTQTIIIASHYDTVKNGGAYDGIAGVVCAVAIAGEIARVMGSRKYSLEVIAFNDEEGMMFGSGCLGSKALTGQVDQEYITHLTDENGISIREWIMKWGSEPNLLSSLKLDISKIRAFYEIHIEQGPVLEQLGKQIGIADCIVGLLRCMVTVEGRADHAGTTPMDMRKDAMSIGAKVIAGLDEAAVKEGDGAVATCGFVRAFPNAMNVIAEKMEFTMDIRAKKESSIRSIYQNAMTILEHYKQETGIDYKVDIKLDQKPVFMNKNMVEALLNQCKKHDFSHIQMVSGAAHDAMIFADKVDTVMVFVPSEGGRSHCPQEKTRYEDLTNAVTIVREAVQNMMN